MYIYMCILYICICSNNYYKECMNLIKSQEGYTGGFRGRKIKGEMQLYQNLKKKT